MSDEISISEVLASYRRDLGDARVEQIAERVIAETARYQPEVQLAELMRQLEREASA